MKEGGRAEILGIGLTTALGLSAHQTAAAVRAGQSRYVETPFFSPRGEPMCMARVKFALRSPLTPFTSRVLNRQSRLERMHILAEMALRECMSSFPPARVALLIGLPETLPDGPTLPLEDFLSSLAARSGVQLDPRNSRVYPLGRAAGMKALSEALEHLETGRLEYVVVGGVDSYYDRKLLEYLDVQGRLNAEGVYDGLRPGEGAGFLLLARPEVARDLHLKSIARVRGAAMGRERGHRYSPETYRGDGLSSTVQTLLGNSGMEPGSIRTVYASLNGESLGAKEWGVTLLRNREMFHDRCRLEHPAEHLGDLGAALAPVMLGLAAIGVGRGYRDTPALVWASSDLETRGAALIER